MRIIVTGPVRVTSAKTGEELTSVRRLRKLSKLVYDEDLCSNYLHAKALEDLDIQGGDLRLRFDAQTGQTTVTTAYQAAEPLNEQQLTALRDETIGQWSDGIGEGCFDPFAEEHDMEFDLCPAPKEVTIEQAEDKKAADKPKRRTIFGAVTKGDLDKVRKAIDAGEDLEAKRRHLTPLLLAVYEGQLDVLKLLIEAGANVHAVDDDGGGALLKCAMIRSEHLSDKLAAELAEVLCAHGADPNAHNQFGHLPLDLARMRKKPRLAAVLESHGACLFDVTVRLQDPQGKPVKTELGCRFTDADAFPSFRCNKRGEVTLKDVTCAEYELISLDFEAELEPPTMVVDRQGKPQPSVFVVKRTGEA